MTDLAYMVREDWAQYGTAMEASSKTIREWLGPDRYALLVTDASKYNSDRTADRETADFIGATAQRVGPASISALRAARRDDLTGITAVALHPYLEPDLDTIRVAAQGGVLGRLFVMVWAPHEEIRLWLDALGALNLHDDTRRERPDPVMVEACRMMVNEEYNSLGSGRGKDVVVGLMRAFRKAKYPSDEQSWARAFLAANGSFRGLKSVRKFAAEIERGVRHRVEPRFREDILAILAERAVSSEG